MKAHAVAVNLTGKKVVFRVGFEIKKSGELFVERKIDHLSSQAWVGRLSIESVQTNDISASAFVANAGSKKCFLHGCHGLSIECFCRFKGV